MGSARGPNIGTGHAPGRSWLLRRGPALHLVAELVKPAGIARCLSAHDVAQSIIWARQYGVPLIARSGGHSAGGYSVTEGLMISTRQIDSARFDTRTGIATVGGGSLNQGVYDALPANNATITHGRCPTVGAAGFLLGGGIGFNIRRLGVASDSLVASQIVTADGEILTLSDSHGPDLFWACRGGGGGNFGISTSFSVRTTPVPGSITGSRVVWDARPDKVMPALVGALEESPVSLGSWTTLDAVTPKDRAAGKDVAIFFEGQLIGTPGQLRKILAPAYAANKPAQATIQEMGYWDAQENFFAAVEEPTRFQNRGLYFHGPLIDAAIATMIHWLRRWPGTSIYARVSFLQTGGQANALPATATAFVHRDNDWYMVWYLKWSSKDSARTVSENLAWLSAFYDAMAPYALPEA
ncbi:MAG: FAD-binding oxidoreductase [Streptosporangiaceae bacterium]